jgi:hypothetical protein
MKLRAGVKISVVEFWNRNVIAGVLVVKRARIVNVVRKRFTRLLHYRLAGDGMNDGVISLNTKGTKWVVGWDGPQVRALKTVTALRGET